MSKKLHLSLKKPHRRQEPKGNAFTSKILRELQPGEVYNANTLLPCGFTNLANVCYATSTFQCLFNHPVYSAFFERVSGLHTLVCDDKCGKGQWNCGESMTHSLNLINQMSCFWRKCLLYQGSKVDVWSLPLYRTWYTHFSLSTGQMSQRWLHIIIV